MTDAREEVVGERARCRDARGEVGGERARWSERVGRSVVRLRESSVQLFCRRNGRQCSRNGAERRRYAFSVRRYAFSNRRYAFPFRRNGQDGVGTRFRSM